METFIGYKAYSNLEKEDINQFVENNISSLSLEKRNFIVKQGINCVYKAKKQDLEMLFRALVEEYIEKTNISYHDIDGIIYAPSLDLTNVESLNHIREKSKNAEFVVVDQTCYGSLGAMNIARRLLSHGNKRVIILTELILTSDSERANVNTFLSDGAAILEVNNISGSYKMIDQIELESQDVREDNFLNRFTAMKVVGLTQQVIETILDKNNLDDKEIKLLVPQNTSSHAWDIFCKKISIDREKVYLKNIKDGGHIGGIDTIKNICLLDNEAIQTGDKVLVFAMGVNKTETIWGTLILEKRDYMERFS